LLGARRNVSAEGRGPVRIAFIWPGSHTKLVEVDEAGRILRSHTSLAGELTSALARHTLLAASLPEALPDVVDADACAAGASVAVRDGLGRAAFLVRIAALTGALDVNQRASFLVGAVIADDVASLARHPILAGRPVEIECEECGGPMGVREGKRGAFLGCLNYPGCRSTQPLPDRLKDQIGKVEVWVGGRQPQRSLYAQYLRERAGCAVFELEDELADRASATGALAVAREHGEWGGLATG
jgi:2-dehydro-3-deoxygalactonokinase